MPLQKNMKKLLQFYHANLESFVMIVVVVLVGGDGSGVTVTLSPYIHSTLHTHTPINQTIFTFCGYLNHGTGFVGTMASLMKILQLLFSYKPDDDDDDETMMIIMSSLRFISLFLVASLPIFFYLRGYGYMYVYYIVVMKLTHFEWRFTRNAMERMYGDMYIATSCVILLFCYVDFSF